jgi:hypothetical protein
VKLNTGAFEALHANPRIGRAEALRRSMMCCARSKRTPPYLRRSAIKLQPLCGSTLPEGALPSARSRRPVSRRTLQAQTWDDRSRLPIVSHLSRAVLQDYPRNRLSTGRGVAGEECQLRKCQWRFELVARTAHGMRMLPQPALAQLKRSNVSEAPLDASRLSGSTSLIVEAAAA